MLNFLGVILVYSVRQGPGVPCYCYCQVTSVVSDSVRPHRRQLTRLPCPWDSPGKNTGVGCHFLLQSMKVKSEREVAQSYPTLSDPMDCSLWGSFLHRIFQARVLEWGAIAFSAWCSIDRYIQRCLGLKHYYTCKLHSKDFGGKIHAVCAYVYM